MSAAIRSAEPAGFDEDHFGLPGWIFMQLIPVSPTETMIREIAYVHPDSRREMRASRYLHWRINRQVNIEDKTLIERVQAGMASSSYTVGPLSENEVCLRSFARRMRRMLPECRKPTK